MKLMLWFTCAFLVLGVFSAVSGADQQRDYLFDGEISRAVLENYLSRAITMAALSEDDLPISETSRMLTHIGAKFVGRTIMLWGDERRILDKDFFQQGQAMAQAIHQADPQIILQAGIFEIATTQVNDIAVPDWVFKEFSQPVEQRHFRYADMLYQDGRWVNHWSRDRSVPDTVRLETQMWYFYLAGSYINIGIEAIHFGQIKLVTAGDLTHETMWNLLGRIRRYAREHARRHYVLCDAHVSSGVDCYGLNPDPPGSPLGPAFGEHLLLDFHALPLRIKEVTEHPRQAKLEIGHVDAIYGRSRGGIAPGGWPCEHLPFLVEFDNWGASGHPGESVKGSVGHLVGISDVFWIWGWDEICWFAHQNKTSRNAWLRYAWKWLKENDKNGHLEMPGLRGLADPVDGIRIYRANTKSDSCPTGFNQEETIKAIWASDPL